MNYKKWNKKTYEEFIKYLFTLKDEKYKEMQKRIIKNNNIKIIGIRIPTLKKIAKNISKENYIDFIKYNTHKYLEENILHGLILGYIKEDEIKLLKQIDKFIPYIDNWETCDTVCANLKQFKKLDINIIKKYINENPWSQRFGLVILLDHYIKEENLNFIYNTCKSINTEEYYVKMAISWLLSICYIKYPTNTLSFLKKTNLDKFTHNKTISKICDSKRIEKEEKEKLKLMRK
ncbi:MAG: DNA alkylation repair protein [Bacilli bacterium]|nr:DNA alkylation repair protein [Bacilli bacterium]